MTLKGPTQGLLAGPINDTKKNCNFDSKSFSFSLLTTSNKFMIPCCIVTPLVTSLLLSLRCYTSRCVGTPLVVYLQQFRTSFHHLVLGPPMGLRVHSSASLQRYYIINFNLQILISYIFVRPIP